MGYNAAMPNKLTWDDLVIQKFSASDAQTWLSYWSGTVSGRIAPVFMSKFGDWILRRSDGGTDELSVIEGTYSSVASTPEEFNALVNTQPWPETHLLSLQVAKLHERGLVPPAGHCYGFAPHPALVGKIDVDSVMILEIGVWQNICAQHFGRGGKRQVNHPQSNS